MHVETAQPAAGPDAFPPGIGNVFSFGIFNAFSFQMVLGSPMILYAKSLGASATVLGIIAGMMPLLVIFQIPAARHVARVGYKRFVLAGWSVRVIFIFLMGLVPVTERFLNAETRLSLMLFLLFFFNLSRGISSCGWFPWITSLIPAAIRGRYLVREAAYINVASLLAFLVAAAALGQAPGAGQFSMVFLFSASMGAASLFFLKKIPEGETPEQVRTSTTPVPWLAIARYAPFRKLLRMNVAWSLAAGGLGTFTVAFLRVSVGMPEGRILLLTSTAFLGGLASLWFIGSRLDRLGSKPVLTFSCLTWMTILFGWTLLAARVVEPHIVLVIFLQFLMGLAASLMGLANTRLAMAVIPEMGRSHFFALFSVVSSLAMGLSPILWGLLIDAFRGLETSRHGFELNRYSLFFMGTWGAFVVTLRLCRHLEEPAAASMEALLRDILEQSPLRIWLRFWPRG
jgi:MFS family permease